MPIDPLRLIVELEPMDAERWRDVDAVDRLHWALEFASKACGMRCVRVASAMELRGLDQGRSSSPFQLRCESSTDGSKAPGGSE